MPDSTVVQGLAQRAAGATPEALSRRLRGISDATITWLFIAPTILLLLAINIFPLIWTIQLSLHQLPRQPAQPRRSSGSACDNYERDPDRSRYLALRCRSRRISCSGRS